jgi:hypothetical protein
VDVYNQVAPLALKYFDTQRCGRTGSEAHGPCHLDDGIAVGGPRNGRHVDASGGWHDAGDYLKFVETTGYVTGLLATACDHYVETHPDLAGKRSLQVVLQYLRFGLEWLLKMHPSPKEFYYQVGDEHDHDTWRLPEADSPAKNKNWKPRPIFFGVGANLAGRVAASFAIAARLYKTSDPAFAARCLRAAQTAYQLGYDHRKVVTTNPFDFYPEKTWADDMEWGAAQLYRTTQRGMYLDQALAFSKQAGPAGEAPNVYSAHLFAHAALYRHAPTADKARLLGYIRSDVEKVRKYADNPYALAAPLIWGTAEAACGAALLCRIYAKLAGEPGYLTLAKRQRDFVLGCNPWNISFVVGAGTHYPLYPHHQIANLRNMELTGALVGGPTSMSLFREQGIKLDQTDFETEAQGPSLDPDQPNQRAVYHDAVQDYVTNEPANDYTAKFLLMAALDAIPS